MPQKDFVAPVKSIEQKIVIDVNELIKDLHKMIKERGYSVLIEQSHKESSDDAGNRNISFYWFAKKKVSNYVKLVMEIVFKASVKNVVMEKDGKKKTVQEGTVSVSLGGYTQKDYEDEWAFKKEAPLNKFFRELIDKFLNRQKLDEHEKELTEDVGKVIQELKVYLKMHRIE